MRDSGFCGGVVDVVAARQVDVYLVLVTEDVQYDVGRVRAGGEHLGDSDLRRLAVVAALRAAEAAEMAVGDVIVLIFGLAVDAVRRVGQLVSGLLVNRDIHAEPDDLVRHVVRQRGSQRAVRIQAQRCIRNVRDALADSVERVRDLAVAVKLVAEDVVDDQTFDRQVFARFAEGCLVALDERVRVRAFAGQRGMLCKYRDDAGQQVRARLVGEIFESRIGERLLDHAGGGGLAVRAGHDRDLYAARQLTQNIFINFQCQLARQVGAAASQLAQDSARCLAHQHRQSGLEFHCCNLFFQVI